MPRLAVAEQPSPRQVMIGDIEQRHLRKSSRAEIEGVRNSHQPSSVLKQPEVVVAAKLGLYLSGAVGLVYEEDNRLEVQLGAESQEIAGTAGNTVGRIDSIVPLPDELPVRRSRRHDESVARGINARIECMLSSRGWNRDLNEVCF